jgi:hypothetical protein
MVKSLLLLLFALSFHMVQACTCKYLPLETASVRNAKQIFIFRLVDARVSNAKADVTADNETIGHIAVISQVRGASKQVTELSFSTDRCCGARLDVGGYFVAFLPRTGRRFAANNGNIMQIGPMFTHPDTEAKIRAVLSGGKKFEDVFSRAETDRTEQEPVLPPCVKPGTIRLNSKSN